MEYAGQSTAPYTENASPPFICRFSSQAAFLVFEDHVKGTGVHAFGHWAKSTELVIDSESATKLLSGNCIFESSNPETSSTPNETMFL
jgi:hypothetical protein